MSFPRTLAIKLPKRPFGSRSSAGSKGIQTGCIFLEERIVLRDSAIVMLFSLSLVVGGISGQENPSADPTGKLRTLQGQFDQWQQTLVGIHFEESTLDQRWLTLLNQERSACLDTMKAANGHITAVESEKREGPRLAQEFLLVDDLSRLTDHLSNLMHFLTASFGVSPPGPNAGSSNPPPSFKWQSELGSMVKPIQPVRALLRFEVYNALEAIGQGRPAPRPSRFYIGKV